MARSNPGLLLGLLLLRLNWCLGVDGGGAEEGGGVFPVVVSTWPFREAVRAAWDVVKTGGAGGSAVDAVVAGCSACEELRCDGTVGPGGSPDEDGETTLDALIMNGVKATLTTQATVYADVYVTTFMVDKTMEIGAVAGLRYVKDAIMAAKLVMEHTGHTLLVGEKATSFAISMGLAGPTNLSSPESIEKWSNWRQNNCQPNFWKNVAPAGNCGPYHPINIPKDPVKSAVWENQGITCQEWLENDNLLEPTNSHFNSVNRHNHDTISMAVIDKCAFVKMGHVAVGTSTNGATFKIPGRVGDGPIPGSSAYGDDEVGACGATGDGDIMMRFLPWSADNIEKYKMAKKAAKRAVGEARGRAYEDLYQQLGTKEGERDIYKMAKIRERKTRDIGQVKCIKDGAGQLLVKDEEIKHGWREYFDKLFNGENESSTIELDDSFDETSMRFVRRIQESEVKEALKRMKGGKAMGPDRIPIEVWKGLGDIAIVWLTKLFNLIFRANKMPEEWRRSILVPIYRGIKLMSHTMKLWERVIEHRLRRMTSVTKNQFGFMPGSYQVVESMRLGMEPRDAAVDAISRIARKYPDFVGAVFALNKKGVHAGACHGWTFQYSVRNSSMLDVEVITVTP
uniref:beta-aspartyl-peptidase n=1 Tax=Aegilops tauschii TaxID=37682 RepID=R7WB00_AEGTA